MELDSRRPVARPRVAQSPARPRDSARLLHVGAALADRIVRDLPSLLQPGDLLRVWFQFEVNPTNTGQRSYGIELDDGDTPLVRLSPSITVLP